jgi:hypothetical protein
MVRIPGMVAPALHDLDDTTEQWERLDGLRKTDRGKLKKQIDVALEPNLSNVTFIYFRVRRGRPIQIDFFNLALILRLPHLSRK